MSDSAYACRFEQKIDGRTTARLYHGVSHAMADFKRAVAGHLRPGDYVRILDRESGTVIAEQLG